MLEPTDLIFKDAQLEKRFADFIAADPGKERGGVLFYTFDQAVKMHWRMHERIFGQRYFGVITDWIVCPNVSNLPERKYDVSDIEQLVAIAEQTAKARGCYFMHFHTHPNGRYWVASDGDLQFWWHYFNPYGRWSEGAIAACQPYNRKHMNVVCHMQTNYGNKREHKVGKFWPRHWVNYLLRRDERYQQTRVG